MDGTVAFVLRRAVLMGKENLEASTQAAEIAEFQRFLESDDIAPVDMVTYGKRLAEIILDALKDRLSASGQPFTSCSHSRAIAQPYPVASSDFVRHPSPNR
jgi:hypothetical protein